MHLEPTCWNPVCHRRGLQQAFSIGTVSLFVAMNNNNNNSSLSVFSVSEDALFATTLSNVLGFNPTEPEIEDFPECPPLNVSCACHTEYASYEGLER
uniref:Uncharacterized protein n=1 Tax=Caenorhabditis japonica TaxID=281687 RepID=A0A8R1IP29_CAEJA